MALSVSAAHGVDWDTLVGCVICGYKAYIYCVAWRLRLGWSWMLGVETSSGDGLATVLQDNAQVRAENAKLW